MMVSPNHDARPSGQAITTLVLHYTGMQSGVAALERLCDPKAEVSAHWLVEEDGRRLALVPEDRRAWHAGLSSWRGQTGLNACSIGIEIVNPGHEFGYHPFPAAQMEAVVSLCQEILRRHPDIRPEGVVGHSDIAPTRKQDPGELFDWPLLAAHGVGLFPHPPHPDLPPVPDPVEALAAIGYDVTEPDPAWNAFLRRFFPAAFGDGQQEHRLADAPPPTLRRLAAVRRLYP
ncbi:MAG: N-acetylmuramoyl-L-alanine amidase [Rhodospirillaceae bacterium]